MADEARQGHGRSPVGAAPFDGRPCPGGGWNLLIDSPPDARRCRRAGVGRRHGPGRLYEEHRFGVRRIPDPLRADGSGRWCAHRGANRADALASRGRRLQSLDAGRWPCSGPPPLRRTARPPAPLAGEPERPACAARCCTDAQDQLLRLIDDVERLAREDAAGGAVVKSLREGDAVACNPARPLEGCGSGAARRIGHDGAVWGDGSSGRFRCPDARADAAWPNHRDPHHRLVGRREASAAFPGSSGGSRPATRGSVRRSSATSAPQTRASSDSAYHLNPRPQPRTHADSGPGTPHPLIFHSRGISHPTRQRQTRRPQRTSAPMHHRSAPSPRIHQMTLPTARPACPRQTPRDSRPFGNGRASASAARGSKRPPPPGSAAANLIQVPSLPPTAEPLPDRRQRPQTDASRSRSVAPPRPRNPYGGRDAPTPSALTPLDRDGCGPGRPRDPLQRCWRLAPRSPTWSPPPRHGPVGDRVPAPRRRPFQGWRSPAWPRAVRASIGLPSGARAARHAADAGQCRRAPGGGLPRPRGDALVPGGDLTRGNSGGWWPILLRGRSPSAVAPAWWIESPEAPRRWALARTATRGPRRGNLGASVADAAWSRRAYLHAVPAGAVLALRAWNQDRRDRRRTAAATARACAPGLPPAASALRRWARSDAHPAARSSRPTGSATSPWAASAPARAIDDATARATRTPTRPMPSREAAPGDDTLTPRFARAKPAARRRPAAVCAHGHAGPTTCLPTAAGRHGRRRPARSPR